MRQTLSSRAGGQRSVCLVEEMVSAVIQVRKTKARLVETMLGSDWSGALGSVPLDKLSPAVPSL